MKLCVHFVLEVKFGAGGSVSVQAMAVSVCFLREPRPRGEAFALRRQEIAFAAGARLPLKRVGAGHGGELLFSLWEARPRGEAFGSSPAGSLLSPRGRGSH